jgi:hypothetical protein
VSLAVRLSECLGIIFVPNFLVLARTGKSMPPKQRPTGLAGDGQC